MCKSKRLYHSKKSAKTKETIQRLISRRSPKLNSITGGKVMMKIKGDFGRWIKLRFDLVNGTHVYKSRGERKGRNRW